MTILNSEDAAIKKCEEIYSQLGEGEKWIDKDLVPKKIIRIKIEIVYTEIALFQLEVQEIQMLNGIL